MQSNFIHRFAEVSSVIIKSNIKFLTFLWSIAWALEMAALQHAVSSNGVQNHHSGGALGAQMNIFERIARLVKVR